MTSYIQGVSQADLGTSTPSVYLAAPTAVVGTALRDARLAVGLTQAEVAAVIGVSAAYISRVEAGERRLLFSRFVKVVDRLGTTPERILGTRQPANPPADPVVVLRDALRWLDDLPLGDPVRLRMERVLWDGVSRVAAVRAHE